MGSSNELCDYGKRSVMLKDILMNTYVILLYRSFKGPPERLNLRQLGPWPVNDGVSNSTDYSNPDILQADIPSQSEQRLPKLKQPKAFPRTLTTSSYSTIPMPMRRISAKSDEIWAVDGEQLRLECQASASKPASRLMWILTQTEDEEEMEIPRILEFEFNQINESPVRHYRPESGEGGIRRKSFPKWRYVFDRKDQELYGFSMEYKERPISNNIGK